MKFLQRISNFFKKIFTRKPKVITPTVITPAEPTKIDLTNRQAPQKSRDRFLTAVTKGAGYLADLSGAKIYLGNKSSKPGKHTIRYIQMPIFDVNGYEQLVKSEDMTPEVRKACKALHDALLDYSEGYFYDEFDRDFQVITICKLWNEMASLAGLQTVNIPTILKENY